MFGSLQGHCFYLEILPSCQTSLDCQHLSLCSSPLSWNYGQRSAAHLEGSILGKPMLKMFFIVCSTNEDRTFYTGALCGLGWNSQTQEGILPEHDIELAFDVRFDVEDITEVTEKQLDRCVDFPLFFSNAQLFYY